MAALGLTAPEFLIKRIKTSIFFLGGRPFVLHPKHVSSSQFKNLQTGRKAHFTALMLIIPSIFAFRKASCAFVPQTSCSAHPSLEKYRTSVASMARVTGEGRDDLSRVSLGASTVLNVVVDRSRSKTGHSGAGLKWQHNLARAVVSRQNSIRWSRVIAGPGITGHVSLG